MTAQPLCMRWYLPKSLHGAVLVLFSLAVSACGGPALIHVSSSHEPTMAPGAPTLLIRLDIGNDERGVRRHTADYLSDGTVIRVTGAGPCSSNSSCGTLERNALTVTGLAALRAFIHADTDLLANPAKFVQKLLPGKPGSGRGPIVYTFVIPRPDGSRYVVTAPSTESFDAGAWAPDPASERLNALAADMVDPAILVGAGGLVQPTWETYQPAKMAVFVSVGNVNADYPKGLSPDISAIGWPFEGTPDTFGTAFNGPGAQRCAFLPSADAMAAVATLSGEEGSGSLAVNMIASGDVWGTSVLLWSAKSPTASLAVRVLALMPGDAAASCADALAY